LEGGGETGGGKTVIGLVMCGIGRKFDVDSF